MPRPRVDSALVALRRTRPGPAPAVRGARAGRVRRARKTLVNALGGAGAGPRVVARAGALGLPPTSVPRLPPPPTPRWRGSWRGAADPRGAGEDQPAPAGRAAGADGYHPLRTLMVALDGLADTRHVAPAGERSVACPGIDGPANLAWRALDALEAEVGRPLPLEVVIVKRSPPRPGWAAARATRPRPSSAADRLRAGALAATSWSGWRRGSDPTSPSSCAGAPGGPGGVGSARGPPGPRLRRRGVKPARRPLDRGRLPGLRPAPRRPAPTGRPPPRTPAARPAWVRNDLWPAALALAPWARRPARALRAAGPQRSSSAAAGRPWRASRAGRGGRGAGVAGGRVPGGGRPRAVPDGRPSHGSGVREFARSGSPH